MSFFPVIQGMVANTNIQYRAFIASTRHEYDLLLKQHHARVVSRVGFVSQEVMDLRDEVTSEIDARAGEIGNAEAACVVEARESLAVAVEQAGALMMDVSHDWADQIHLVHDEFVSPLLKELEMLTSILEIEMLVAMGYFNIVTELESLVTNLYFEAVFYAFFFEQFVDEIILDFRIFEDFTRSKNERLFPLIGTAATDFAEAATIIRDSLPSCTA